MSLIDKLKTFDWKAQFRVRAIVGYAALAIVLTALGFFYGLSHGRAITEAQVTAMQLRNEQELTKFLRWQMETNDRVAALAEEAQGRARSRDAFFNHKLNDIKDAINATPDPLGCSPDALDADELRHFNAGNRRGDAEQRPLQ